MNVYVVGMYNENGDHHVLEVFSNEAKANEYQDELLKLYDELILNKGWSGFFCERTVDVEHLELTGHKEHYDKIDDPEWCERFNTRKFKS